MKIALVLFLGVWCMSLGACIARRTDNFNWGHKTIQYCSTARC